MKPIAIIGDSWATGPAPFQPNLGEAFSKLGIPNEMFQVFMTGDVLKDLDGIIASGQGKEIGSHYSMVLLSLGSHDIAAGTPDATIIKNLVGIGNDCAKMGLKCEIIAFPKITTNGVDAWFPTPEKDWYGYDVAAKECHDIQVLHGAVGDVLENFPALENQQWSQYVPHYNQLGAEVLALLLVGIYDSLNA